MAALSLFFNVLDANFVLHGQKNHHYNTTNVSTACLEAEK